ncbi:MAG: hypothetical protein QOH44_357, partial [Actinomycetota bacterium]|nr:hypothetical protein [Actinomycetota bacterium]
MSKPIIPMQFTQIEWVAIARC